MCGLFAPAGLRFVEPAALKFHFVQNYFVVRERDHVKVIYYQKRGSLCIGEIGVIFAQSDYEDVLIGVLPKALAAANNARGLMGVN